MAWHGMAGQKDYAFATRVQGGEHAHARSEPLSKRNLGRACVKPVPPASENNLPGHQRRIAGRWHGPSRLRPARESDARSARTTRASSSSLRVSFPPAKGPRGSAYSKNTYGTRRPPAIHAPGMDGSVLAGVEMVSLMVSTPAVTGSTQYKDGIHAA
jgi:hypothetical protein